jgi:hypothetical protein
MGLKGAEMEGDGQENTERRKRHTCDYNALLSSTKRATLNTREVLTSEDPERQVSK